ncbi:Z1 domain-containing protein [Psychrobacter sp. GP33]|uniref:Z1 domain-containing protein n=1 Tax=Psychrobacter sp. GP33 TaxID=2758709 RepID=UPI0015FA5764|nr:Z1 domain-containing protein [Psychrobacter sp. GP33]
MKEYEVIKNYILAMLISKKKNNEQGLVSSDIENEISNVKDLWEKLDHELFYRIVGSSEKDFVDFPLDDYFEKMKREFEEQFNVRLEKGVLIQGENSQKRDTSWWTNRVKQEGDNYYSGRNLKYLKEQGSLSIPVIQTINIDTDNILDNIENPKTESFDIHGMVVGHVQSGKTGNYSNLICKAADAGYKFIVVVAGGTNILRSQTQERINNDFIGFSGGSKVGVGLLAGYENTRKPVSLTTLDADFNKADAIKASQGLSFDTISTPVVLVIKKNTTTLTNVINWLASQYRGEITEHAILMIDDESDYASIDTSKEEDDPSTINRKLRKLLSIFTRKSYIAYTATPYANVFIDDEAKHEEEKDLFPEDFIYALDVPSNYFGAEKIFLGEDRYLISVNDYKDLLPSKHNKHSIVIGLSKSLKEAIHTYLINIAIRHLRGQVSNHNSMLIHISRFTNIHKQISILVDEYLELIQNDLYSYGRVENALEKSSLIADIFLTYSSHNVNDKPSWISLLNELSGFIKRVVVREVHGEVKENKLEYIKSKPTYAIVVGGQSLSRGFTLEGLTVSYFLRNTKFYDTLMQMGRWFGYRVGYEDLCRIYTTPKIINNFSEIISATNELFIDFGRMSNLNKTPKEFGLCVKESPGSALQITAKNKQKNADSVILDLNLDGRIVETSWIKNSIDSNNNNIITFQELIKSIGIPENVGKQYLWRDVSRSKIQKFLNKFEIFNAGSSEDDNPLSIISKMPTWFVKKYAEEKDTLWDIALYSGNGEEFILNDYKIKLQERKFDLYENYFEVRSRQVSSGNAESLPLYNLSLQKSIYKRKEARLLRKKPLLMLHLIEPNFESREKSVVSLKFTPLAAFGISFHGEPSSGTGTMSIKVNTVWLRNYYQGLNDDYEDLEQ